MRDERTGWRDLALSMRHRKWGYDCPMLDLDFLCLEYDEGVCSGIVEYKNEHAEPVNGNHASIRALANLGDRARLPVFAVRYTSDFQCWTVTALNELAREWVPAPQMMGEEDYVALLYRIRGRTMPVGLFSRLELSV